MTTRVRFAPSPTGQIHIGNIRTAIFNWLYARHTEGKFLLRIEDTDRERSTPEAIQQLHSELDWLKLEFDENVLYQSSRINDHLLYANRLLTNGLAYKFAKGEGGEATLFRIPWDDESFPNIRKREIVGVDLHPEFPVELKPDGLSFSQVSKKGKPMPTQACLAGFRNLEVYDADGRCIFELEPVINEVVSGAETFKLDSAVKMTYLRREVVFTDIIKGELAKPLDNMKDVVIVRADGTPVFHLANVCDDIYQEITHIIRGDDHVENTYRHILLFQAIGGRLPRFAHLPMIINAQGKPYSKRDGDAYVGELRDHGYLPDAVFNYLTLLGWSPGNDLEKMSRDQIIDLFSIERIQRSPAQMDPNKLLNMNGLYMAELPEKDFIRRASETVKQETWGADADDATIEKIARLMHSRTKVYAQIKDWSYFFVDDLDYDKKDIEKHLKRPGIKEALIDLKDRLAPLEFSEESVEEAIHATTDRYVIKRGKLNLPLRIAVTGTKTGAGIYEIICVLGKERVLRRLIYVIANLA